MHNVLLVQVLDGAHDLAKFGARLLLLHAAVSDQVVEHFAAARVLHHQVERLLGLYDLEELDDVRVVETLHDLDLAEELLQAALVELRLVDDLDGDLFADELVARQLDLGEVALADGLDQPILANVRIVGVACARAGRAVRARAARCRCRRRRRRRVL